MSNEQNPEVSYEDSNYNEDGEHNQEQGEYESAYFSRAPNPSCNEERQSPPEEGNQGFVSRGRMPDRHVPPRDFPHPQPNDPNLAYSPVYGHPPQISNPYSDPSYEAYDEPYPPYFSDPENDLAVPEYPMSSGPLRPFHPNIKPAVDPSLYDHFELPPARPRRDPSSTSSSNQSPYQEIEGRNINNEEGEGMDDLLPPWCSEHRDGPSDGESNHFEFGVVGTIMETFWPKPGDILILANERKGCAWPAFDGHLEIYVDDDYFSKRSLTLQWNYDFSNGDIVLRFGDFDRHWRWRANDHIYVFLRNDEVFYLVARQAAQELHPLDFRFVDPRQRPVHAVQYHMQPRVGDFILRKGSDDSYLWNTCWWHPGGDSHLLLKHLKLSYPQGPDPKYRWTCHWYKRGFKFRPEDVLLRVGYESAEDNKHSYCVCELYFRGPDGLWTFQGRDDYSFGPPSHT
ncbi:unnamed protein product [Calypogeia fissa]